MIPCICIDDTHQPSVIPPDRRVKAEERYHITHIYKMKNMGDTLGCDIYEKPMGKDCYPYEHWRLDRFAVKPEDIERLIQLAMDCGELNDTDMNEIREMQHGELQEA